MALVERLELLYQLLHIVSVQLGILLDALLFLHQVDGALEVLLGNFGYNISKHLDKSAVCIVGKPGVLGECGDALNHLVIEAQVEDGIHHAGHRGSGAGTDRNQQRVFAIAELFARECFQLGNKFEDLCFDLRGDGLAVFIVPGAGFRGHGEAVGNGHAQAGHFRQVGAFAAEQFPHRAIALRKQINILFTHDV